MDVLRPKPACEPLVVVAYRNPRVRDLIRRELEGRGLRVSPAASETELAALAQADPCAAIVESDLPPYGAGAALARFREAGCSCPAFVHVPEGEALDNGFELPDGRCEVVEGDDPARLAEVVRAVARTASRLSAGRKV